MRIYRREKWTLTITSNPEGAFVGFEDYRTLEDAEQARKAHLADGHLVPSLHHAPAVTEPDHYHALAGLSGYMPNMSEAHETYEGAVDSLVQVHDLGKKRAGILRRDGYLALNPRRDGNEYAEVSECQEEECWTDRHEGLNAQEPEWACGPFDSVDEGDTRDEVG